MKYLILIMLLSGSAAINIGQWLQGPQIIEVEKIVEVAVNEVSIPMTYNADEIDSYCEYDHKPRMKDLRETLQRCERR